MNTLRQSLIQTLVTRQIKRYKEKGALNTLIAFLLLLTIMVGGTYIGEQIWPQNIENIYTFTVKISVMLHFGVQFISFLMFLPGYLGHKAYKPYEINQFSIKPWDRKNWNSQLLKTIGTVLFNKGIIYPSILYISVRIGGPRGRLTDFPSPLQVFVQIVLIMFMDDFFFYWFHKISHQYKFLYKFHKVHHQYDNVYSLVAEHSHPVDYLFGILLPSSLPLIIMSGHLHFFMIFFWQIWKIYLSSERHSGYEFPWSPFSILPLVSGPSYHDFHHSKNVGNFSGSIYLWDTIYQQNDQYFKILDMERQAKKQN